MKTKKHLYLIKYSEQNISRKSTDNGNWDKPYYSGLDEKIENVYANTPKEAIDIIKGNKNYHSLDYDPNEGGKREGHFVGWTDFGLILDIKELY